MADEVFDGSNMVRQLFGEGEGVPDEAGDALTPCVVEPLDVVGLPRVLRNGFVLRRWNDPCVDGILIRIKRRLLLVDRRQIGPQLFRTRVTAIPDVERKDLPCLLIHSDPHPLLVRFFSSQSSTSHRLLPPDAQGSHLVEPRQTAHADDQATPQPKAYEPSNTDTDSPANAMQRDFLAE